MDDFLNAAGVRTPGFTGLRDPAVPLPHHPNETIHTVRTMHRSEVAAPLAKVRAVLADANMADSERADALNLMTALAEMIDQDNHFADRVRSHAWTVAQRPAAPRPPARFAEAQPMAELTADMAGKTVA